MKTALYLMVLAIWLAISCAVAHGEDYTYITNNGTITITGYTGPGGNVTIPSTIDGLPVTSIGDFAFSDCNLTYVTLPNSITNIGYSVFWECRNLTAIYVEPQNTTYSSLDGVLFNMNQTMLVAFPPGRTGAYVVPNTVTTIGDSAFGGASLTNVTIPQSVSYIGYLSFIYAYHLTAAFFLGDCPALHANAFTCADNLILYYLPGTAGWSSPIERLALPWYLPNPKILGFGPNFGIQTDAFGFRISWATNASVLVEASTTLANPVWSPVSTNLLVNGWSDFSDAEWTNHPARFYRVRQW